MPRGHNLTPEDRERGGRISASRQQRSAKGLFAGVPGKSKPSDVNGQLSLNGQPNEPVDLEADAMPTG